MDWAPVKAPAPDDIVVNIWNRLMREVVRPVLASEGPHQFFARIREVRADMGNKLVALAEMRQAMPSAFVDAGGEPTFGWAETLAEEFGGESWKAAMVNGVAEYRRTMRVLDRIDCAKAVTAHEIALLGRCAFALDVWLVSLLALCALEEDSSIAANGVIPAIRDLLANAPGIAYLSVREAELIARNREQQVSLDLPVEVSEEEQCLLDEAELHGEDAWIAGGHG